MADKNYEEKELDETPDKFSNESAADSPATLESQTDTDDTESKDSESQVGDDENKDSADQEDIYKSELERVKENLFKTGQKVDKERGRRVTAERALEEVENLVEEKVSQVEKRLFRSRAEQLASEMAGSVSEKDLILHHYDNSIIPSGNLEEDIENAYALANRRKLAGTISELRKAAQSKKNVRTGGSDAGTPTETKKPPTYSQDIIDGAKFAGTTPEKFAERMEKEKQK